MVEIEIIFLSPFYSFDIRTKSRQGKVNFIATNTRKIATIRSN